MRCDWAERSEVERRFHDTEWGVPLYDDTRLFEHLTLHGARAGLALRLVLDKRENYRRAFHGFDIGRVAAMSDGELAALALDRGLIRHRLKLASVRGNARGCQRIVEDTGSLSAYLWDFVGGAPVIHAWQRAGDVPCRSEASDRMSAALHQRGFRFAGTALCYALMQSAGMVNDHLARCECSRSERRLAP
ncbi:MULTISPECIES: DNA-3-methyladenine glycosylase I [Rhodanobacteraceae]|uniref:DNA-3-methyladenine glycosylase I n=1 Tax=Rhodanobacteraceae TaxID=1775411 RepID=UPI00088EA8B3|nr:MULTISPECIES: DNA-3-methyladenine glycosylase I [Rhodanobacteraceae]SDG95147.1 DNA-3-methyladenine glycosylase I [Dyella sp. 333MFSha]SKB99620.1 DNA-3-methyladenine glycosylase I [Luteibacter sp. 22Crub2.1]